MHHLIYQKKRKTQKAHQIEEHTNSEIAIKIKPPKLKTHIKSNEMDGDFKKSKRRDRETNLPGEIEESQKARK